MVKLLKKGLKQQKINGNLERKMMEIRKAETKDISAILNLLKQVNLIHHNGRPDIFNIGQNILMNNL